MRVIGVADFGAPEALREFDVDERHAGPGEVRLRVRAAAVNPTDTVARSGVYAARRGDTGSPHVPGMDAAGDIDEVGPHTETDLAVGDAVMAVVVPSGSHGAYSEHLVVPAESAARIPAGAGYAAASTLPMNGLTARLALDRMALEPGATLAVTGAAGAFGGYMVQLAKAEGLRVIADAAEKDEQLVRDLGADTVVRRGDDVAARILDVEPGGVDALADGAVQDELVGPAVRDGGRIATVRGFQGDEETLKRGVVVHPVLVVDYHRAQAELDGLRAQAEDGALSLRVARTFPADQAAEAHRLLEAGGVRGRLVLEF
ncbi:NADP-dependent oxidoreductase [Streptomonospora salina]|uniref:NADPH:quinone reductase-like Zn-dependent oxidoreductase n=1 Tax=Streptomonospora salina TaxID=104205 RepID=A0A841E7D1_9ACTN|nr:NADP-dependent oxidoreductase [Streptomonospora salina]MBB5997048.1 NADPH:quinone reductase-like Zn-dependent oxidoreductase [Streptomonospora salina]